MAGSAAELGKALQKLSISGICKPSQTLQTHLLQFHIAFNPSMISLRSRCLVDWAAIIWSAQVTCFGCPPVPTLVRYILKYLDSWTGYKT